ncbi:AEC family transporter [Algoriphagus taiwanensis]|uniref:Permease n=1 Tax=Algoriphagus taiwanensis TaxID=1445656 RepID=A0ABQ6Q1W0_9BACT|nr:hypothetical protein Ataiwa_12490 [Algoriphagus taiwanensis]
MVLGLEKTVSILLLILLGYFLRGKLIQEDHKKGLKVVILDLSLPAMIFVALLGIKMDSELLLLPVLVLTWNAIMLGVSYFIVPWLGVKPNSPQHRTWMLLFPSLAPGLSCFPFIIEFLGEEALAWAAIGDVGNKLFVLVISYLLAMSWYYRVQHLGAQSNKQKVKSLLLAMLKEPINLVLISSLLLLSFGFNLSSLPEFFRSPVLMLKDMMTPLILLFIGVSVVLKWTSIQKIFSILMLRAGISLLISGLILTFIPISSATAVLFLLVFPLSSASFWPFAHMAGIAKLESQNPSGKKTFDLELAINILAVSLPFSTMLILSILTGGEYFLSPAPVLTLGGILCTLPFLPRLWAQLRSLSFDFETEKSPSLKNSPK